MHRPRKRNLLGVLVDAIDMENAAASVLEAARANRPYAVSALAVHGVMTAVADEGLRHRVNSLDLAVPDGQPVRWGLNVLHGTRLREPVRGKDLTLEVCKRAAAESLPVFLYGSRPEVIAALGANLRRRFPTLAIAGSMPSLFRTADGEERDQLVATIRASDARIVFVGLGCPRQEVFVHDLHRALGVPVLAVGAAFDYVAGSLREPPRAAQRIGLEWVWRLAQEPRRLWHRYLLLNPAYLLALGLQATRLWHPTTEAEPRPAALPL